MRFGVPSRVASLIVVGVCTACHGDTSSPDSSQFTADAIAAGGRRITVNGGSGTCALVSGKAFCWGQNTGSDNVIASPVPVAVSGAQQYISISVGGNHSCALTSDGQVWCWGDNKYGQLGDSTFVSSRHPVRVKTAVAFREISAGLDFNCGLAGDGSAYCWGSNGNHELGGSQQRLCNGLECAPAPAAVPATRKFTHLSAGSYHTCAITAEGQPICWGLNVSGQTGTASQPFSSPDTVLGGIRLQQLALGGDHTCGLALDGKAFCWGKNFDGQVGTGGTELAVRIPLPVATSKIFKTISASSAHTCALQTDGIAFCWGTIITTAGGSSGSTVPVQVPGGAVFTALAAGADHACGISPNRVVYCWGANTGGQLGNGSVADELIVTPAPVKPAV